MILRYSLRLYGPRSRLQMLQMKLASWEEYRKMRGVQK